jgi:peptidyl-tRNA hydrolase, PTH1 family
MSYIIVGLGNPGEEYEETRHNTGRMMLDYIHSKLPFSEWREDRKLKALVSEGKIGKEKAILLKPETFMNRSGYSVRPLVGSVKAAAKLIVIYDDLDLGLGSMKISFNRGSGGHRGLESIVSALKTREFVRVRVGISPVTPSGRVKKPQGEKEVQAFILGAFKKPQSEILKKVKKKIMEAVLMIVEEGREKAMGEHN